MRYPASMHVLVLWLFMACTLLAGEKPVLRLQVIEPYLDLHTGPGRGYPVFQIAERGEWITVLKRRTDWFKVRLADGTEGWVPRAMLERTLTAEGKRRSFRDVLLDDYLNERFLVGLQGGRYDADAEVSVLLGWRSSRNFRLEAAYRHVSGTLSSTRIAEAGIVSLPFVDWRLRPSFSLMAGQFENRPSPTLINARPVDAVVASYGFGAEYYLTRRFVVRADWRRYTALTSVEENRHYDSWLLGVMAFF